MKKTLINQDHKHYLKFAKWCIEDNVWHASDRYAIWQGMYEDTLMVKTFEEVYQYYCKNVKKM